MKPVAHMMLRAGVSWKELAEALKLAYVETATEKFGKYGRPANGSRVAILTGLSRKEVKRLRDLLAHSPSASLHELDRINRATRVLSAWHQDPDFISPRGKPRLLSPRGSRGFEDLVKRYAPDIPATAMLKELQSVGAIGTTPKGKIRAQTRSFIPSVLDTESVARFGSVLSDVGSTIAHNLLTTDRRARFERRSTNMTVKRASRRAFQDLVDQRGMELLGDIDQWLTDHETDDAEEKSCRLGLGVYLIMDDEK
jgi:hypothetical protein